MPLYLIRRPEPGHPPPPDNLLPTGTGQAWQSLATSRMTLAASAPSRLQQFPIESTTASPATEPVWVALDGYVSNRSALLQSVSPSSSARDDDLALIAHLYLQGGSRLLHQLEGAFVVCVAEPQSNRLFIMRDRLGGRRLCWQLRQDGLEMATRAADLIGTGAVTESENPHAMARFFSLQYPVPGSTPYRDITELRPGECLRVDRKLEFNRPPFTFAPPLVRNETEWTEHFVATLEQSVQAAIGDSGPVASMLSGGLDSGPITALAHHQLLQQQRRLVPISWLLKNFPKANESRPIRALIEHLGCHWQSFDGSGLLPFRELDETFISPELPAYNAFRELVLRCYQEAADAGCRIILNGHAGDRIYAPQNLLLIDQWRTAGIPGLWRSVATSLRTNRHRIWRDPAVRHPLSRLLGPLRRTITAPPVWLTEEARKHWQVEDKDWPPEAGEHPHPDFARQLLGTGMTSGLAQENEFPARFGIERRDPYQNEALLRLMLAMPLKMSFRDDYDKWIMRQAMKGRLPERLRLKPRTGRLGTFFDAGFDRHRAHIHQLLFVKQPAWQRHVKSAYVEQALDHQAPDALQKKVITRCVGYALWRRWWEREG